MISKKSFESSFGEIKYLECGSGSRGMFSFHGAVGQPIFVHSLYDRVPLNEFKVIAPYLPGHGKSYSFNEKTVYESIVDSLHEMVSSMNLKNSILIGHSLGGRIAIDLYLKKPNLFSHLVLFSPMLNSLNMTPETAAKNGVIDMLKDKPYNTLHTNDVGFKRANLMPTNLVALKNLAKSITALDKQVDCKTMIIWGRDDSVLSLKHNEGLFELFDNLELTVLDGHHYAFRLNLDDTVKRLLRFID